MDPVDSDLPSRIRSYSGAGRKISLFGLQDFHPLWSAFQSVRLEIDLVTSICPVLQPSPDESGKFGLVRVRSPLLTESLLLSFPKDTEMFQFPSFAAQCYGFTLR